MAFITFISPYRPIICGIADYTEFLTRTSPPGRWDVISFNLQNYGLPLSDERAPLSDPVWYGIPSRKDYSATCILEGLRTGEGSVLWFQHEFGIWNNSAGFVGMLKGLNHAKVVTLHSLHFQSSDTSYGLSRREYSFLHASLPHTDAITVFSDGVRKAVIHAFPEYSEKVRLLRHGTHLYPGVAALTRATAKSMIHEYLAGHSGLDRAVRENFRQQGVFLDADTVVIGGAGFVTVNKGINRIYQVRDALQRMLPGRKIAAVYVGLVRDASSHIDMEYATKSSGNYNGPGRFFLQTYLPRDMLALLLRALDVHLYWPRDCTQSGIMAHALGAGATIACRDMEGVGETVRMAGGLTCSDFGQLIVRLRELVLDPGLREEMSQKALRYAEEFSWRNQALKHFELAEQLHRFRPQRLVPALPLATDTAAAGRAPSIG